MTQSHSQHFSTSVRDAQRLLSPHRLAQLNVLEELASALLESPVDQTSYHKDQYHCLRKLLTADLFAELTREETALDVSELLRMLLLEEEEYLNFREKRLDEPIKFKDGVSEKFSLDLIYRLKMRLDMTSNILEGKPSTSSGSNSKIEKGILKDFNLIVKDSKISDQEILDYVDSHWLQAKEERAKRSETITDPCDLISGGALETYHHQYIEEVKRDSAEDVIRTILSDKLNTLLEVLKTGGVLGSNSLRRCKVVIAKSLKPPTFEINQQTSEEAINAVSSYCHKQALNVKAFKRRIKPDILVKCIRKGHKSCLIPIEIKRPMLGLISDDKIKPIYKQLVTQMLYSMGSIGILSDGINSTHLIKIIDFNDKDNSITIERIKIESGKNTITEECLWAFAIRKSFDQMQGPSGSLLVSDTSLTVPIDYRLPEILSHLIRSKEDQRRIWNLEYVDIIGDRKTEDIFLNEILQEKIESKMDTSLDTQSFVLSANEVQEIVSNGQNKRFSESLRNLIGDNTLGHNDEVMIRIVDNYWFEPIGKFDYEDVECAEDRLRRMRQILKETQGKINHTTLLDGFITLRSSADGSIFCAGVGLARVQSANVEDQIPLVFKDKPLLERYVSQLQTLNELGIGGLRTYVNPWIFNNKVFLVVDGLKEVDVKEKDHEKKDLIDISLGLKSLE